MFTHEHVRSFEGRWIVPPDPDGAWGVRRVANGSLQVVWTCRTCGYRSTPIPHYVAERHVHVRELPIIEDYAGLYARCIVRGCGSDEVEWHHLAPRAIFEDAADDWGIIALCRKHHQEWGERVTPQLNPPRRGAA